jgi:hypothetical protein
MMTPIHAGSEDYFKQLNGLKSLPSDPATLQYLNQLLNNPNSPFEKFLVGGKIQQIQKDLAAQKGMQAQGQVSGGLPTIKEKLQQTASLLAAQTAAQGKGPMPVPQHMASVTPEQEAQMGQQQMPEEAAPTMEAAHGGIMQGHMRDDMFSFAPGGIVAFADEGLVDDPEYDRAVKEKAAEYDRDFEAQKDKTKKRIKGEEPAEIIAKTISALPRGQQAASNQLQGIFDLFNPQSDNYLGKGSYQTLNSKPISTASSLVDTNNPKPTAQPQGPTSQTGGQYEGQYVPPELRRNMIPPKGTANMQAIAGPGPAPQASPTGGPMPPGNRQEDLMKLVSMLGGNPNGKPPGIPAGAPGMMQTSMPAGAPASSLGIPGQTQFDAANARLETMLAGQNKTDDQLANERLKLSEKFGIGTYATEAKAMAKERQKRQDEMVKGRGYQDAMAQLAAYATPGARWSDVVKTDLRSKAAHMETDRAFQTAQDNYLDSVNKMLEEQRVGNFKGVEKNKDDQDKLRVELAKQISHNLGVSMQTAGRYIAAKLAADSRTDVAGMRLQNIGLINDLKNQQFLQEFELKKRKQDEIESQNKIKPNAKALEKQIGALEKQLLELNKSAYADMPPTSKMGIAHAAKVAALEKQIEALRSGGGGISDLPTGTGAPKSTLKFENGKIVPNK